MTNVELSIQLQTDSIAAVKSAMMEAVADRPEYTLWWLADYSHDITYQDRITGSTLAQIDQKIANVDIGSSLFGPWFSMQNSYFSTDKPITGVSTLKQAIETFYRWRVAGYFNDIMKSASSDNIVPQYVFPNTDYILLTYEATSDTTTLGTITPGSGPLDITKIGPGILSLTPTVDIGSSNDLVLTITAVYQDGTTVPIVVTVPQGTTAGEPTIVGEHALTGSYSPPPPSPPSPPSPPGSPPSPPPPLPPGTGQIHVADTTMFKVGQWVLLREDLTDPPDYPSYWKTEIAEVKSVDSGTLLTVGQPRPTGAAPSVVVVPGLRNSFSTSAFIYPLFVNVAGVTAQASGNTGDVIKIGFDPDRPQGFLDISDISYPQ